MKHARFHWLDQVLTADLPDGAKVVAAYLFARADKDTLACHPKQNTIAKDTGRSVRATIRAIQALADAGFLDVVRDTCYSTNNYRLQVTPVSPGGTSPQVTPVSPRRDASVMSPSDSSVMSPSDSSVTSSKQAFKQTNKQGVAVMKSAAEHLRVFQLTEAQAETLLDRLKQKGVEDGATWLTRKMADMAARRVRVNNPQSLVRMLLKDIDDITEAEVAELRPVRAVTEADVIEELERWM